MSPVQLKTTAKLSVTHKAPPPQASDNYLAPRQYGPPTEQSYQSRPSHTSSIYPAPSQEHRRQPRSNIQCYKCWNFGHYQHEYSFMGSILSMYECVNSSTGNLGPQDNNECLQDHLPGVTTVKFPFAKDYTLKVKVFRMPAVVKGGPYGPNIRNIGLLFRTNFALRFGSLVKYSK